MDLLFEFISELILETAIEGTKSKKVPKWIRYILGSLILAFYFLLFGLIIYVAIMNWEENKELALFLIFISSFLLLFLILDAIKVYKKVKRENQ